MPKRLAANLLVIAPAALIFVIWAAREKPPENSLAWHKQQYLALFNKRAGQTLKARQVVLLRAFRKARNVIPKSRIQSTNLSAGNSGPDTVNKMRYRSRSTNMMLLSRLAAS